MAVIKQVVGTRVALAVAGLAGLVSSAYVASDTYDCTVNQPVDVIIELAATPGTTTGNKQLLIFVQESLNGVDFRSGPTSGTSTTDENNLKYIGQLSLNTSAVQQRGFYSLTASLGYVPPKFRLVIKNESGVTISAGEIFTAEISNTLV